MCGIGGFITPRWHSASVIEDMISSITHRGPDDEGYFLLPADGGSPVCCGGQSTQKDAYSLDAAFAPAGDIKSSSEMRAMLALGHRRLSILDLSPIGHQPMCSPDRRYWIVYNGEIYNFIELRQELEAKGYSFISHTDTEVILAAYAQWGQECLHRFNGMWAFAIYDTHNQDVFLARDRFGVKPLYFWMAPDHTFCFGSEIKQFTAFPGWTPRINPDRVRDFLVFGITDHTDETMFKGVNQIPGGHFLRLPVGVNRLSENSGVHLIKWYKLDPKPFVGKYEDAVKQYRSLFEQAVELRLRADVPIGTGLSGGLDSSAIVCQMNNVLRKLGRHEIQNTFSACASDERFDERKWIAVVAKHTSVKTNFVFPTVRGLFDELSDVVWHHDEPFHATSVYAEWCVFKEVGAGQVKVTLDGHGADEILAGYHSFLFFNLVGLVKDFHLFQVVKEIAAMKQRFKYSWAKSLLKILVYNFPKKVVEYLRVWDQTSRLDWLNIELLNTESRHLLFNESHTGIRQNSMMQVLFTSLPHQLHWADRDSMAHSIEMRVPYLDYRLVEFVVSCPDIYKVQNGITKRMHRDAMSDTLPREIAERADKIGFATPESLWVQESSRDEFFKAVQDAVVQSKGLLNARSVEIAREIIYGNRKYDGIVWRWICFGAWMKRFNVAL